MKIINIINNLFFTIFIVVLTLSGNSFAHKNPNTNALAPLSKNTLNKNNFKDYNLDFAKSALLESELVHVKKENYKDLKIQASVLLIKSIENNLKFISTLNKQLKNNGKKLSNPSFWEASTITEYSDIAQALANDIFEAESLTKEHFSLNTMELIKFFIMLGQQNLIRVPKSITTEQEKQSYLTDLRVREYRNLKEHNIAFIPINFGEIIIYHINKNEYQIKTLRFHPLNYKEYRSFIVKYFHMLFLRSSRRSSEIRMEWCTGHGMDDPSDLDSAVSAETDAFYRFIANASQNEWDTIFFPFITGLPNDETKLVFNLSDINEDEIFIWTEKAYLSKSYFIDAGLEDFYEDLISDLIKKGHLKRNHIVEPRFQKLSPFFKKKYPEHYKIIENMIFKAKSEKESFYKNNIAPFFLYNLEKMNHKRESKIIFHDKKWNSLIEDLSDIISLPKDLSENKRYIDNNRTYKNALTKLRQLIINWDINYNKIEELFSSSKSATITLKTISMLTLSNDIELLEPLKNIYAFSKNTKIKTYIKKLYDDLYYNILFNFKNNFTIIFKITDKNNSTAFFDKSGKLIQITNGEKEKEKVFSYATGYSESEINNVFKNIFLFHKLKNVEFNIFNMNIETNLNYKQQLDNFDWQTIPFIDENFENDFLIKLGINDIMKVPGIGLTLAIEIFNTIGRYRNQHIPVKLSFLKDEIHGLGEHKIRSLFTYCLKESFINFISKKKKYFNDKKKYALHLNDTLTTGLLQLPDVKALQEKSTVINSSISAEHHIEKYKKLFDKHFYPLLSKFKVLKFFSSELKQSLLEDLHSLKFYIYSIDQTETITQQFYNNLKKIIKRLKNQILLLNNNRKDHREINKMFNDLFDILQPIQEKKIQSIGATCSIHTQNLINNYPLFLLMSPNLIKLNMCGILSDLRKFRLPTTTKKDINLTNILKNILSIKEPDIDIEKLWQEQSKSRTIKGQSAQTVLLKDAKTSYSDAMILGDIECQSTQEWEAFKDTQLKDMITLWHDLFQKNDNLHYGIWQVIKTISDDTQVVIVTPNNHFSVSKEVSFNQLQKNPIIVTAMIRTFIVEPLLEKSLKATTKIFDKYIKDLFDFFIIPNHHKPKLQTELNTLIKTSLDSSTLSFKIAESLFRFLNKQNYSINTEKTKTIISPKIILNTDYLQCIIVTTPSIFSRKNDMVKVFVHLLEKEEKKQNLINKSNNISSSDQINEKAA